MAGKTKIRVLKDYKKLHNSYTDLFPDRGYFEYKVINKVTDSIMHILKPKTQS